MSKRYNREYGSRLAETDVAKSKAAKACVRLSRRAEGIHRVKDDVSV